MHTGYAYAYLLSCSTPISLQNYNGRCTKHETIGAALQQIHNGVPHPVAFYSRKMKDAELNYNTREKELLAIKEALRVWQHFLIGCAFKVYY